MILGILVFFFLPNYPETSNFLSKEEKALQEKRLGEESSRFVYLPFGLLAHVLIPNSKQKVTWTDAKATLTDWRLYAHYFIYTGVGCLIASLSLFAPTIVLGLGYEGLRAQLFTVPPYAVAFVTTVAVSFLSDRLKTRGIIVGACMIICCLAFLILGKS